MISTNSKSISGIHKAPYQGKVDTTGIHFVNGTVTGQYAGIDIHHWRRYVGLGRPEEKWDINCRRKKKESIIEMH